MTEGEMLKVSGEEFSWVQSPRLNSYKIILDASDVNLIELDRVKE